MEIRTEKNPKECIVRAFQVMRQTLASPNWKPIGDEPCKKYSMYIGDRLVIKSTYVGKGMPYQQVYDLVIKNRIMARDMDPMMVGEDVVQEIDDILVIHEHTKGIFPVAPRDLLIVRKYHTESPTRAYMLSRSLDGDVPPVKGAVRMLMNFAAIMIEDLGTGDTALTIVTDSDIMGMIPQIIKNQITKMYTDLPRDIMQGWRAKLAG